MNSFDACFQLAESFLNYQLQLEQEKFFALLSEDVVMERTSNGNPINTYGFKEVSKIYKERFFNVTRDIKVISKTITPSGLNPCYECIVTENKINADTVTRIRLIDNTQLVLSEENGVLKVVKIFAQCEFEELQSSE